MARKTAKHTVKLTNVTTDAPEGRTVAGVKIETVPMPSATKGPSGRWTVIFSAMEVGESFELVGERERGNVNNAVSKFQKGHMHHKFSIRTMVDPDGRNITRLVDGKEQQVFRCFRVPAVNGVPRDAE